MPMSEWARRPGAAAYHTISKRLDRSDCSDEDAVFLPRHSALRDRKRQNRMKREAVVLAPAPYEPPPFRPSVGRFRSFPICAIETLRRIA